MHERLGKSRDLLGNADKPYDDEQLGQLREYLVERGGEGLTVYEVTRLLATIDDDRKKRDEQIRAAYYKGRDYGKRMERNKREKLIEGFIERAHHWKARAQTADGQLRNIGGKFDLAGSHVRVLFTHAQLRIISTEMENARDRLSRAVGDHLEPLRRAVDSIDETCTRALRAAGDEKPTAADDRPYRRNIEVHVSVPYHLSDEKLLEAISRTGADGKVVQPSGGFWGT